MSNNEMRELLLRELAAELVQRETAWHGSSVQPLLGHPDLPMWQFAARAAGAAGRRILEVLEETE